jgi:hypothetical protein
VDDFLLIYLTPLFQLPMLRSVELEEDRERWFGKIWKEVVMIYFEGILPCRSERKQETQNQAENHTRNFPVMKQE